MKFKKTKHDSLAGGVEVRYTEDTGRNNEDKFQIIADKAGVRFKGRSDYILDQAGLQEFAKSMSDAWTDHKRLKPKLDLNAAGH